MFSWTILPPELWVCIIDHATYVPATLEPDVYDHKGLVGANYTKAPLRDALITKRAFVRVCKQWWHLAIPFLYRSVYIGRSRSLSSLSRTLVRSAAKGGTLVATRPLGEYTQRLDIAMRDHSQAPEADLDSLVSIITCMPHLAIVSYAATDSFFQRSPTLLNRIPDILQRRAGSLRVLDWSSRPEPFVDRTMDLLVKCTQLRIIHCRTLILPEEHDHCVIPPSVTTLRLHTHPFATEHLMNISTTSLRTGPSALQELILDFYWATYHWEGLLRAYSSQLVSVHFYVYSARSVDASGSLQILAQACPRLSRFTITSDPSFFIRSHPVFPAITYLGLRSTRAQTPRTVFERLFVSLEDLRSRVPSLRVVQLLNEKHVQCLLKTHTKLAVRKLQSFMALGQIRLEDKDGVLLTDRLKALGHMY